MLEFAATLEHPAQSVIPLVRGLRSTNQTQLRASSILDTVIRMCNAASDAPSAISWIRLLAELETKHSLPAASPDTLVKPFRTFAVHRLNVKQRCALLRSHYELAAKALPQRTFAALWAGSRIPLGSLRGRKGNTYTSVALSRNLLAACSVGILRSVAAGKLRRLRLPRPVIHKPFRQNFGSLSQGARLEGNSA